MPSVDGYLDCHKKKDKESITFVLQLITNNYEQPVTPKEQLQAVFFRAMSMAFYIHGEFTYLGQVVSHSAVKLAELGEARLYFYIRVFPKDRI